MKKLSKCKYCMLTTDYKTAFFQFNVVHSDRTENPVNKKNEILTRKNLRCFKKKFSNQKKRKKITHFTL